MLDIRPRRRTSLRIQVSIPIAQPERSTRYSAPGRSNRESTNLVRGLFANIYNDKCDTCIRGDWLPVTLTGEEYVEMMGVLFTSQYLSGRESYLRLAQWQDEIQKVLGQNGFSGEEINSLGKRFSQKAEQVREQTANWREKFFESTGIMASHGTETTSVRMLTQDNQIIDVLVDLGFQNSRSDAIAYFAHKGIEYNRYWLWLHRDDIARAMGSHRKIADEIRGRSEVPVHCPKCRQIIGIHSDYIIWRSGGVKPTDVICSSCRSAWTYEIDVRGVVDIRPTPKAQ
jgi:hypothetical protein